MITLLTKHNSQNIEIKVTQYILKAVIKTYLTHVQFKSHCAELVHFTRRLLQSLKTDTNTCSLCKNSTYKQIKNLNSENVNESFLKLKGTAQSKYFEAKS